MFGSIKLNAVAGDGSIGSLCGSKSGLMPCFEKIFYGMNFIHDVST